MINLSHPHPREAQLTETETNLAQCRTGCRQKSEEIEEHLESINKLGRQIKTLRSENIDSTRHLQNVIEEKLSMINRLELDVDKCRESINCKSLEITQANEDKKDLNKTITGLRETINQLNDDVETLNKQHCEEINSKECLLFLLLFRSQSLNWNSIFKFLKLIQ